MEKSALQKARAAYQPKLPVGLQGAVKAVEGAATQSVDNQEEIKKLFPNTYGMPIVEFEPAAESNTTKMNVGIILSGGQAPGGHNVITGLFDQIKKLNPENRLYGFILGPGGLVDHNYMELTPEIIDDYRNTGGFDMIGSGRTKLEKVDQFEKGLEIIRKLDIKAIVIIGGDDSNTNACVLAEYYAAKNYGVQVIGCPKTIDGDLKNDQIETSFGFDTACKTYSELIGNIERDCNSARKYWHFIKVMGRSASHIALECALQTQPNICLVSEEIEQKGMSLDDIVTYIANTVCQRAADGNNFGTVIIPEGVIEFIPAIKKLIAQLNDVLALPEVKDINMPIEGVFHDCCIVSIKKQFPMHARKVMHALWGMGQMMNVKMIIVVDDHVDVQDYAQVAWRVFNNIDADHDLEIVHGPLDVLDHSSPMAKWGAKLGIDATKTWPEEGHAREWPEEVATPEEVKAKVDAKWKELGLD